jgi:hypothetical protein
MLHCVATSLICRRTRLSTLRNSTTAHKGASLRGPTLATVRSAMLLYILLTLFQCRRRAHEGRVSRAHECQAPKRPGGASACCCAAAVRATRPTLAAKSTVFAYFVDGVCLFCKYNAMASLLLVSSPRRAVGRVGTMGGRSLTRKSAGIAPD